MSFEIVTIWNKYLLINKKVVFKLHIYSNRAGIVYVFINSYNQNKINEIESTMKEQKIWYRKYETKNGIKYLIRRTDTTKVSEMISNVYDEDEMIYYLDLNSSPIKKLSSLEMAIPIIEVLILDNLVEFEDEKIVFNIDEHKYIKNLILDTLYNMNMDELNDLTALINKALNKSEDELKELNVVKKKQLTPYQVETMQEFLKQLYLVTFDEKIFNIVKEKIEGMKVVLLDGNDVMKVDYFVPNSLVIFMNGIETVRNSKVKNYVTREITRHRVYLLQ